MAKLSAQIGKKTNERVNKELMGVY